MNRILVTGISGQVGGGLMRRGLEDLKFVGTDRDVIDLSSPSIVRAGYRQISPDLVVNCAAYTAVDEAEDAEELAFKVNAEGPGELARLCALDGIPIIQISTDYVFDGNARVPYKPGDPVNPQGVYGASKLAGELEVARHNTRHIILRTSWVYSAEGRNFVNTMLRLARERDVLGVVSDQFGSPTAAIDIAEALAAIVNKLRSQQCCWGTYHFCNTGVVSWHEFALEIFRLAGPLGDKDLAVETLTTEQFPTKANRPAYSGFDSGSFTEQFDYKPRAWNVALADVLHSIKNGVSV